MPSAETDRSRRLSGRRAIVTGSTSGIGHGIAKVLAEEGAAVAIVGRSEDKGERIAQQLRDGGAKALFHACDVSDEKQIEALVADVVEAFGGLDALVCSAGIGVYEDIVSVDTDDLDAVFRVNIRGMMLTAKHAIPHIQEAGGGSIVNISSVHSLKSSPGDAPYAATKGAIDAFTRSTALDFAPAIRVNAIQPGWIESALTKGIFDGLAPEGRSADDVRDAISSEQPMKRIGQPDDVGRAAAFLLSGDASFITGSTLLVDGGLTAFLES